MNLIPNPGTLDARFLGCTCARMDNHYGRGYHGQAGVFAITGGCPLHDPDSRGAGAPSPGFCGNSAAGKNPDEDYERAEEMEL